jgi:hypothetical protein
VAVLLPFVEERRQELLARLRHHFEVPFRTANGEVIEDVRDLEIGHIEYQLATRGRAVPPEVRLLKRIRNCLAHQETVEPALVFQATAGAG